MKPSQEIRKNGINMRKWCAEHEALVLQGLKSGDTPSWLLATHDRKLAWLQHERLCHLIVTALTAVLLLFSIWLVFYTGAPAALLLVAIALILTGFYIRHYFFLENTVQRWYVLRDELDPQ